MTVQSGSAVYAEAADTTATGFTCVVRSTSALNREAGDVSDMAINRDYGVWYQATDDSTISRFGSGGGGGGGGPHDHAEYALVEHDHDEFVHDHDYLPLSGGTLTGTLWLAGGKSLSSIYGYDDATRTVLRLVAGGDHVSKGAMLSLYGGDDANSPHMVRVHTNNKTTLELNANQSARLFGDLQVDGSISGSIAHETHATGNFIVDNVLGLPAQLSDTGLTGQQPNICLDSWGWVRRSNWSPSRMAFAPSKLTRDSDVLGACRDCHAATRDRNR